MRIPQENRYNLLVVGPLASKPAYSKMTKLGENPRTEKHCIEHAKNKNQK